jgi:Family of unknown function (DUF6529)
MENLIDTLTRGNVAAVKIVLASVVTVLALYQVFLMVVGYGKLPVPFLRPAAASATHRAVGDTVIVVTLIVAFMCFSYSASKTVANTVLTRGQACTPFPVLCYSPYWL